MMAPLRDPRYRSLDVWRGLACLMIVLHHSAFVVLDGGKPGDGADAPARWLALTLLRRLNLGVPLFFVISGYCILASADSHRRDGRSSFRFLKRRFWRIFPPYWCSCLYFAAVTLALPALGVGRWLYPPYALEVFSPRLLSGPQWLGNLTLTESWRPLIGGGPWLIWTRVAWSLCYEEQFYFVCFLALLLSGRHLHRSLAILTLAFGLFRVVAADIGQLYRVEGTFPILWHEFAIGLIVYWRLVVVPTGPWSRVCVVSLVALLLLGLYAPPSDVPVNYSLIASSAFGLILIALREQDRMLMNARWTAPLRACGLRCYSIYLVHLPACTVANRALWDLGLQSFWARAFITMPLSFAFALATCWPFYWLVERHFLNPPIAGRSRATTPDQPGKSVAPASVTNPGSVALQPLSAILQPE